jgi:fibronectin-binding autotransporter adhesin
VSGGFSLASNQTLMGLGTVNGGMSLSEGATLSPGASPGLITVNGDLNAQAGSTMLFELASTNDYDRVVGVSALTLAGTINVTLFNAYNPTAGATFDLFDWSGVLTDGGYTLNTPVLDPGYSWDTTSFETDGTLTVIPEPATIGLLGLMGAALLLRRRSRRT